MLIFVQESCIVHDFRSEIRFSLSLCEAHVCQRTVAGETRNICMWIDKAKTPHKARTSGLDRACADGCIRSCLKTEEGRAFRALQQVVCYRNVQKRICP